MSTDSICWLRVKADPIEQIRYCPDVAIHFKYSFVMLAYIYILFLHYKYKVTANHKLKIDIVQWGV